MKTCILIPAFNCANALPELLSRINLPEPTDEIIIVNDASTDGTETCVNDPRVFMVTNEKQLGYGGSSQRLYQIAFERNADFTINIHGDLGHRPEDIEPIYKALKTGTSDLVYGSRLYFLIELIKREGVFQLLNSSKRRGMPLIRVLGHFALTWFQNLCFGTRLHSFHEGMRGCNRKTIEWILKNDFPQWYDYDTTLILKASKSGFKIGEVATPPHYDGRAKSSAPPIRYGLTVVKRTLQMMLRMKKNESVKSS